MFILKDNCGGVYIEILLRKGGVGMYSQHANLWNIQLEINCAFRVCGFFECNKIMRVQERVDAARINI